MQMRAYLLVTAAMSASPSFSADAVERESEQPSPSQIVVAPAATAKPAKPANAAAPTRKSKRVRHSFPAPTRM